MRRMMVVLAVLTVVTLVGCSSSKKSSSTVAAGSNSSGSSGTSAPSGSSGTSAPSGSSSSGSQNLNNIKFCNNGATNNVIQQLQANSAAAIAGNSTGALQNAVNILKGYESNAPSAIRADVTTLVNFETKYLGIITADKGNPQKLGQDMQGVAGQAAQLQAATQHIEAWALANCHS